MYRADQRSLAKLAPSLTAKACWPSSLERQNVKWALRVFDISTSSALKACCSETPPDTHLHTAAFITIICDIWKMFNINNLFKGIRLNELSHPFVLNDPRLKYVARVIEWLDKWRNLSQKTGKLTTQTFTSFRHSCIAITSIINHLIEDCDFTYVLTSFLQNDPLEHHFGLYRMLSGAQYHISYCQILESERRMKLFSSHATTEQLSIDEFISSFSTPSEHQCFPTLDLEQFISYLQNYSDVTVTTQTLQALTFIAGYTVHSYYKKSNRCQACLSFLTEDKEMEIGESLDSAYTLLQSIDRGSLKWPSTCVIEVVVSLWKICKSIQDRPLLFKDIVKGPSRQILVKIILRNIEEEESQNWRDSCPICDTLDWVILEKLITSATNCFLSNLIKNMNSLH